MTDGRFVDKEAEMAVKVGVKVGRRLREKICIHRSQDPTSVRSDGHYCSSWLNSDTSGDLQRSNPTTTRSNLQVSSNVPANSRYVDVHTSFQRRLRSVTSRERAAHSHSEPPVTLFVLFSDMLRLLPVEFVHVSSGSVFQKAVQVVSASSDKLIEDDCDWFAVDVNKLTN